MSDLQISRLLVLIQIICVPLYFLTISLFGFIVIDLDYLPRNPVENLPALEFLLTRIIFPLFFSLPWILPAIIDPNRMADTYALMGKAITAIRVDHIFFYGINAAFVLLTFIFPFFSPALSIVGAVLFMTVFVRKKTNNTIPAGLLLLIGIVLAIIPIFAAISFYVNAVEIWSVLSDYWVNLLPIIYLIALCTANAIIFGDGVFLLVNRKQTQQTIKRMYQKKNDLPLKSILLVAFLIILLFSYDTDTKNSIILYFTNILAIILSIIITWYKWRFKISYGENRSSTFIVLIFLIANTIRFWIGGTLVVVVVLASILFFGLFFFSYKVAGEDHNRLGTNDLDLEKK